MVEGLPQETPWSKWRSIAAISTAAVVVIGGVSGAATLTHNYFATDHRVDQLRDRQDELFQCINEFAIEYLDLKLRGLNHYVAYINDKTNILAVNTEHPFDGQVGDLQELRSRKEQSWGTAASLRQQADELAKRRLEDCDKARRRNQ